jgi:hypothetical protein
VHAASDCDLLLFVWRELIKIPDEFDCVRRVCVVPPKQRWIFDRATAQEVAQRGQGRRFAGVVLADENEEVIPLHGQRFNGLEVPYFESFQTHDDVAQVLGRNVFALAGSKSSRC